MKPRHKQPNTMSNLLKHLEAIKAHGPCGTALTAFTSATSDEERAEVVVNNIGWVCVRGLTDLLRDTHAVKDITEGVRADDWRAVRWAAENGHTDRLEYLHSITDITEGIRVWGWCAVRYAAEKGHTETLAYLHSIIDITDGVMADDWYAVRWAARYGHTDTLAYLRSICPDCPY